MPSRMPGSVRLPISMMPSNRSPCRSPRLRGRQKRPPMRAASAASTPGRQPAVIIHHESRRFIRVIGAAARNMACRSRVASLDRLWLAQRAPREAHPATLDRPDVPEHAQLRPSQTDRPAARDPACGSCRTWTSRAADLPIAWVRMCQTSDTERIEILIDEVNGIDQAVIVAG
jgi:hypothetical protein